MISERVKFLREQQNITQSELARKLSITRSSINAWEMGISVPSTQYIVELAHIFQVSTDYLLGVDVSATINVSGLSEQDIQVIQILTEHLRHRTP